MVLVKLTFFLVVVLLIARLLAARATMSERTFGLNFLLGSLIGILSQQFIHRLVTPYDDSPWMKPQWAAFLTQGATLALLMLIVAHQVYKSRSFRAMSLADVFMGAFCLGLGAQVAPYLLQSPFLEAPITGYKALPPFVFKLESPEQTLTFAGYGLYLSIIAVGVGATVRFTNKKWLAWIVGPFLLLWMSLEAGAFTSPPEGFLGTIYKLGRHGSLMGWIAIAAVIGFSVLESKWEDKANDRARSASLLDEWLEQVRALLRFKFGEWREVASQRRTERRARIVTASAASDDVPPKVVSTLVSRSGANDELRPLRYSKDDPGKPHWTSVWGGWIALAVTVIIVPRLPEGAQTWLWTTGYLHYNPASTWTYSVAGYGNPIPVAMVTLLTLALAVVFLRRWFASAGRAALPALPDEKIGVLSEQAIFAVCFGLIVACVLYPNQVSILPNYANFAPKAANVDPRVVVCTVLSLVALAATGTSALRSQRWRQAPVVSRRKGSLRTALRAFAIPPLVPFAILFYSSQLVRIQDKVGPDMFAKYGDLSGNYPPAMRAALLTGVVLLAIHFALNFASDRAVKFMTGDLKDA